MMAEASNRRARGDSVTFEQACDEYLRYVEHVRQIDIATVKDYRGVIDGYLRDEFGELPIDTITPDLIDAYKERLIAEGRLSARVIVRHLTVLHGIFKRAGRAYGLERNPASADLVERPRVVYTGEFDTFTGEEVELLAGAAQDDAGRRDLPGGRLHRTTPGRAVGAAVERRGLRRRAAPRPAQLHGRPREDAEGEACPSRADDAAGGRHARPVEGPRLSRRGRRPRVL